MEIFRETIDYNDHIVVQDKDNKFIIGWYGSDLYWIMLNYTPNNSFIITKSSPKFFNFFEKLFSSYHFKNCTFNWTSEARLPENSSRLKITKGKDFYRIKFIQNTDDYFARLRNICPICFCLNGSRNQDIANTFSVFLHSLLNNINF